MNHRPLVTKLRGEIVWYYEGETEQRYPVNEARLDCGPDLTRLVIDCECDRWPYQIALLSDTHGAESFRGYYAKRNPDTGESERQQVFCTVKVDEHGMVIITNGKWLEWIGGKRRELPWGARLLPIQGRES